MAHLSIPSPMRVPRLWLCRIAILIGAGGCWAPKTPESRGLASDLYRHFRTHNVAMSNQICRRLGPILTQVPSVYLHGDAHLEQYIFTERFEGLSDFDDASFGPAALDYVRFAASILVALEARGQGHAQASDLLHTFNDGYWHGIEGSASPSFALRNHAAHSPPTDRVQHIAQLMKPLNSRFAGELQTVLAPYLESLRARERWTADFVQIVDIGRLDIGCGSRRQRKYLVRLQGASAAPNDDEFLEVKQISDLSGIPCVDAEKDPLRIHRSARVMAQRLYRGFGGLTIDGTPYWTHLWTHQYQEVRIAQVEDTALSQVVRAASVQLGVGHRQSASAASFETMKQLSPVLLDISRSIATEMIHGWKKPSIGSTAGAPVSPGNTSVLP